LICPKGWREKEEIVKPKADDGAPSYECMERQLQLEHDTPIFPFMKFPPEVRDMVFEVGLVKKGNKKPPFLQAFHVNQVLYASALPIYYRQNMHSFSIMQNSPSKQSPHPQFLVNIHEEKSVLNILWLNIHILRSIYHSLRQHVIDADPLFIK